MRGLSLMALQSLFRTVTGIGACCCGIDFRGVVCWPNALDVQNSSFPSWSKMKPNDIPCGPLTFHSFNVPCMLQLPTFSLGAWLNGQTDGVFSPGLLKRHPLSKSTKKHCSCLTFCNSDLYSWTLALCDGDFPYCFTYFARLCSCSIRAGALPLAWVSAFFRWVPLQGLGDLRRSFSLLRCFFDGGSIESSSTLLRSLLPSRCRFPGGAIERGGIGLGES